MAKKKVKVNLKSSAEVARQKEAISKIVSPEALIRRRKTYCFFLLNKSTPTMAMLYFSRQYNVPIVKRIADLDHFDVVLFSLISAREFWRIAELFPHKRPGQEWIGGGNAVTNPTGVKHMLDFVYIGQCWTNFPRILDGERDLPGMLDCRNSPNARVVYNDEPILEQQLSDTRILLSTGCRRKCLFCTNTFREPYREQPKEVVIDFLTRVGNADLDTRTVYLQSNSTNDVSYYADLERKLVEINTIDRSLSNAIQGVTDQFLDVRTQVSHFGEVLIGVEGMSERLRWFINKPISRDMLRDTLIRAFSRRVPVRTCHQFNLPGEDMYDWLEFKDLYDELRSMFVGKDVKAFAWAIPFIPTQISAQTPLQWWPIKYDPKRKQFIQRIQKNVVGQAKGSRMINGEPRGLMTIIPTPRGGAAWFEATVSEWVPVEPRLIMALKGLPLNEDAEFYVDRVKRRTGGQYDFEFLLDERPEDFVFPWDHVEVATSKAEMLQFYKRMKRKMAKGGVRVESRGQGITRRVGHTADDANLTPSQ